jgi:hypothetical protein
VWLEFFLMLSSKVFIIGSCSTIIPLWAQMQCFTNRQRKSVKIKTFDIMVVVEKCI